MRYLEFASREAARARSAREAEARGCGPVTERWWASEADPATGAACLLIDEGDEGPQNGKGGLTPDERANLSDTPPDWLAERDTVRAAAMQGQPARTKA